MPQGLSQRGDKAQSLSPARSKENGNEGKERNDERGKVMSVFASREKYGRKIGGKGIGKKEQVRDIIYFTF